jgi:methyl-accepting chemotaxis protein
MALQNLKVGWRLALGIGVILAIAACATLLVLYKNVQTEADVREFQRSAQINSLLGELSANGRENMFVVANLLLDGSASAVADAKAKLEANRAANQKALVSLDKLMAGPEEAKMLADVKERRSSFISARNKMIDAYGAGQKDAALGLFHSDVTTTVARYQQALTTTRDAQEDRIAHISQSALDSVSDSRFAIALGSLIALIISVIVGFLSTRSVAQPIGGAVVVANAIAGDQLDNVIAADRRDEIGQLLAAMKRMQDSLLERRTKDRETIDAMTATRHALEVAGSAIMLVDPKGEVRYANQALTRLMREHEAELRRALPSFQVEQLLGGNFEQTYRTSAAGVIELARVTDEQRARLALGELTFALTLNPIYSATRERLGTVVTWVDRTADLRAETELTDVVGAAARGDFSPRLTLEGKEGYFRTMSEGMNTLMETCQAGLGEVARVLGALARGDLTQAIERDFEGAFAQLKSDVNQTVTQLQRTVLEIRGSSEAINVAAHEIAQGNIDLSQRTEQQAGSLQTTASSVEQLTATVQQNAENARQANQLAIGASDVAVKGGAVVGQVVDTMKSISDSSQRISDIIGVIDSIAFQTNILALNAAVEAARAGEQGRGFAVVATEVRSLAQRCTSAAKEIKDLISESSDKVNAGSKLVDAAGRTMKEIVDSVRRVTDIMSEISAASAEQSAGFQQVNGAIAQMDQSTQQNAALVEQAAAAAESMRQQADRLSESVGVFDLGQAAALEYAASERPSARPPAAARSDGGSDRPHAKAAPVAARRTSPKARTAPAAAGASPPPDHEAAAAPKSGARANHSGASATAKSSKSPPKELNLPKDVVTASDSDDWEEF